MYYIKCVACLITCMCVIFVYNSLLHCDHKSRQGMKITTRNWFIKFAKDDVHRLNAYTAYMLFLDYLSSLFLLFINFLFCHIHLTTIFYTTMHVMYKFTQLDSHHHNNFIIFLICISMVKIEVDNKFPLSFFFLIFHCFHEAILFRFEFLAF